jgi:hypothetical protein
MKHAPKTVQWNACILFFLFGVYLILLSACGGDGGGSDTSSDTGSVSFRLILDEPASKLTSSARAARSPSGDICVDYLIETISVEVFDASNTPVASESWPCSDHQGTINEVPAGSDISLLVDGIVVGGSNDWQGKIGGLSVFPDQITDAGEVHMAYKGDDTTRPEVVSTDPLDGTTDFLIDADLTSLFSEDMVPASVDETTFTLKFGSTAVKGAVDYDLMTLIATFKPDSNLSYFTNYTATISSEVEDRAGNNMAEDFTWNFTTERGPLVWDSGNWDETNWN